MSRQTRPAGLTKPKGTASNIFLKASEYPKVAVSFARRLHINHLGPLLRVRRDNDDAEKDIFPNPNGELDEDSLLRFVGNNNGFISKAFDQSGNGSDINPSSNSTQARIVNNGTIEKKNGKPTANLDGSDDSYSLVNTFEFLDSTTFIIVTFNDDNTSQLIANASPNKQYRRSGGVINYAAGGNKWNGGNTGSAVIENNTNTVTGTQYILSLRALDKLRLRINGTDQNPSSTRVDNQSVPMNIVGERTGVAANIELQEFILFKGDQSAALDFIENDINDFYNIF